MAILNCYHKASKGICRMQLIKKNDLLTTLHCCNGQRKTLIYDSVRVRKMTEANKHSS